MWERNLLVRRPHGLEELPASGVGCKDDASVIQVINSDDHAYSMRWGHRIGMMITIW